MFNCRAIYIRFVSLGVLLLFSGCISIGKVSPVMKLPSKVETEKFSQCMAPLAAGIKPGFEALIERLGNDPGSGLLNDKLRPLLDLDAGFIENKWNVLSKVKDLLIDISENVHVTTREGFDLSDSITKEVKKLPEHEAMGLGAEKAARRTEAYIRAYFTKSASHASKPMVIDSESKMKFRSKLAEILNRKPEDPAIGKAMDELSPELQRIADSLSRPSSSSSASGFVGRDGTVYAFPGIVAGNGSGTVIDHNQIGADFIRIIFESLRDTYAPLPALANSTAVWITRRCDPPSDKYYCDFKNDGITGLQFSDALDEQEFEWKMDRHGHIPVFKGRIKAEQFEEIEANARNAESTAAEAVGKAIRGGSWGALNNEAVAKFIETAAGVLARHVSERAQWCALASK